MDDLEVDQQFNYKPHFIYQLLWMAWGVAGFLYLYLYSGSKENDIFFLFVYACIIITSVMGYFNRQNGFNHRIQFFDHFMVVPRPMLLWFWQEKIIFYSEITSISFGESRNLKDNIPFEIYLNFDIGSYRIISSKLTECSFLGVFNALKERIGFDDVKPEVKESETKFNLWQMRIRLIKFICFLWCIVAIFFSRQYLWLIDGQMFVFLGAAFAVSTCCIIIYIIPKKEAYKSFWQEFFLLAIIFIYGGVGFMQTTIAINGYFDTSEEEIIVHNVVQEIPGTEGGMTCFYLAADLNSRFPASENFSPARQLEVCNDAHAEYKIGDQIELFVKNGLFGHQWVKKSIKLKP